VRGRSGGGCEHWKGGGWGHGVDGSCGRGPVRAAQ
jgi:hypothetical protein